MSADEQVDFNRFVQVLSPIFTPQGVNTFAYACSLLRVGGMQDAGWDALLESQEILDDIIALTQLELPGESFKNPEKTRWRLALISYAHLTEIDAPYHILANLLRIRSSMTYVLNPFDAISARKRKKKEKFSFLDRPPPPSPKLKIKEIKQLAERAGFPGVGNVFDDFYFPTLRHAIDHSDYILYENEFRMPNSYILSENKSVLTSTLSLERLGTIISRAYTFYSAVFTLEKRARAGFAPIKGKCFPFDHQLKGLIEFLIDNEGLLCGFKVHWPNNHDSIYRRLQTGCDAINISYGAGGIVNFDVGEYFREHDPFSRLVPLGGQPEYTPAEGSTTSPQWPSDSDK